MGHPAPSGEGVRRNNHGRSLDRRDVWVGQNRPLDYERAVLVGAEVSEQDNEDHSPEWSGRSAPKKGFDGGDIVRDVPVDGITMSA
jgi:hypothetical protein